MFTDYLGIARDRGLDFLALQPRTIFTCYKYYFRIGRLDNKNTPLPKGLFHSTHRLPFRGSTDAHFATGYADVLFMLARILSLLMMTVDYFQGKDCRQHVVESLSVSREVNRPEVSRPTKAQDLTSQLYLKSSIVEICSQLNF